MSEFCEFLRPASDVTSATLPVAPAPHPAGTTPAAADRIICRRKALRDGHAPAPGLLSVTALASRITSRVTTIPQPPMRTANRRGFTFAELLVALAVIGVLAGIGIPRYHTLKSRAYVSAMRSDLGTLRVAQESYFAEHQVYSLDVSQLDFKSSSDVTISLGSSDPMAGWTGTATHRLSPTTCRTATGHDLGDSENGAVKCADGVPTGVATPGN